MPSHRSSTKRLLSNNQLKNIDYIRLFPDKKINLEYLIYTTIKNNVIAPALDGYYYLDVEFYGPIRVSKEFIKKYEEQQLITYDYVRS